MKLIFQFPFGLLRYKCLTTGASSGCVSSLPNVSDDTDTEVLLSDCSQKGLIEPTQEVS